MLSTDEAIELNLLQKCTLINEDAITCTIILNKLVNTLMCIIKSKKICRFRHYAVKVFLNELNFKAVAIRMRISEFGGKCTR